MNEHNSVQQMSIMADANERDSLPHRNFAGPEGQQIHKQVKTLDET